MTWPRYPSKVLGEIRRLELEATAARRNAARLEAEARRLEAELEAWHRAAVAVWELARPELER